MIVLLDSARKWFSELTWGSIGAFVATGLVFLGQDEAINWMLDMGLWYTAAVRIHKMALAFGLLVLWFSRSPKETPLFSNAPNGQKIDADIAKKN